MTWTKLGSEFFPECMHHGLSDAATRTHCEAIAYLYEVEETSCTIPKRLIRTFTGSEQSAEGIEVLVALEWWKDRGDKWEIVHHSDVIRQSIAAQQKQRATSKKTSAKYRQKKGEEQGSETTEVTRHVTPDADRQTDKHLGTVIPTTCKHRYEPGVEVDPWLFVAACDECQDQEARRSA